MNGFRFHVRNVEHSRQTQNNDVSVRASTSSFTSTKDQNPTLGNIDYYGTLTSIIELIYSIINMSYLIVNVFQKAKDSKDEDRFLLANFTGVQPHKETFLLASQES